MGLLVEGKWHDRWHDTNASGGRFARQDALFRDWVTADGSAPRRSIWRTPSVTTIKASGL